MSRKIEVIAECGINHDGDMAIAKELIHTAKACGADIAKFQLYDPTKRDDLDEHPYKDILLKSKITRRELYFLNEECKRVGIEFMCSVFDVERVGWCEEINMKRYKIASKSVYDEELAEAIFKTGKPIIISYGMINPFKYPCILNKEDLIYRSGRVNKLYCISRYPASLSDINFKDENGVQGDCSYCSIFNCDNPYDGYSDHTIGISTCLVAMSLGARIIEKHFTLDKTAEGPDHLLSAEPEELLMLCQMRDDIEKIL